MGGEGRSGGRSGRENEGGSGRKKKTLAFRPGYSRE